jgi:hypothetical protein
MDDDGDGSQTVHKSLMFRCRVSQALVGTLKLSFSGGFEVKL